MIFVLARLLSSLHNRYADNHVTVRQISADIRGVNYCFTFTRLAVLWIGIGLGLWQCAVQSAECRVRSAECRVPPTSTYCRLYIGNGTWNPEREPIFHFIFHFQWHERRKKCPTERRFLNCYVYSRTTYRYYEQIRKIRSDLVFCLLLFLKKAYNLNPVLCHERYS